MTRRARLAERLHEQRGFTMLLAIFTLAIATLLIGAAFIAVLSDTQLSRNDLDQKRAYAAAQAGIQAYNYQLNQNENFWQTCTSLPSNAASGGVTTVPGSSDSGGGSESYAVTPLPASTAPSDDDQCDPSNALETMIEGPSAGTASGTFRIKSVGTSGSGSSAVSRTIVAQYKPPSFLNYVYYTDYETLDPSASGDPASCAAHYPNRGSQCGSDNGAIDFITGDTINGPLHSEDTLAICGDPVFGRPGDDDAVEAAAASGAPDGWYDTCAGSKPPTNPTFNTASGTINTSAPSITPPPTNTALLSVVQPPDHFTGSTTIVLDGDEMDVTNAAKDYSDYPMPIPSNGVVYVSTASSGCGVTYTPFDPSYTNDANCGNVYVSGTYSTSLTIASDNDIIINGNICTTTTVPCSGTPTGSAVLGLIANDFVRIYHPVNDASDDTSGGCTSSNGQDTATNDTKDDLTSPTIYAAILAVNHSFIVDNYNCGAPLGTLTVYGAIAQLFRGTVGTLNGNNEISSGYTKSYNYDDRLANEEPPYFLSPSSAAWTVSRETECDSSSAC